MTNQTTPGADFSVAVVPSGRVFQVSPQETILAAGIRQNIGLPYGCKDGACGSCKCRMLTGSVSHGPHQASALSAEEEQAGFVLTCCATPLTDLQLESRQVTASGALPVKKLPTRVSSLQKVSSDVMLLTLQLPGNENFQYRAGQYVEFLLRDGARRAYSMATAPAAGSALELHIRHLPGGKFTDHVFGAMKEKEILRIEGPFGSFSLQDDATQPLIFLASGTGLAPLKALLEDLQRQGRSRATTLYWGGRRPHDLYLHDWVTRFALEHPWLQYVPVVSDALETDHWNGRTGLVHLAVLQDHPDLSQHQVYACGVPGMVEAARRDFCGTAQLPAEAFFADAFISEADRARA